MKLARPINLLAGVLPLALAIGTPVQAQEFTAAYETQSWSQDLLRRFHGVLLRAGWSNGVEISLEGGAAGWDGRGSTCLLPIPGWECGVEPLDLTARSVALSASLVVLEWETGGGSFLVAPKAGLAGAHVSVDGTESGRRLEDSVVLAEAGGAIRYRSPGLWSDRLELVGEVQASLGADITPWCADCYNPLDGSTFRHALVLGLVLGGF